MTLDIYQLIDDSNTLECDLDGNVLSRTIRVDDLSSIPVFLNEFGQKVSANEYCGEGNLRKIHSVTADTKDELQSELAAYVTSLHSSYPELFI